MQWAIRPLSNHSEMFNNTKGSLKCSLQHDFHIYLGHLSASFIYLSDWGLFYLETYWISESYLKTTAAFFPETLSLRDLKNNVTIQQLPVESCLNARHISRCICLYLLLRLTIRISKQLRHLKCLQPNFHARFILCKII